MTAAILAFPIRSARVIQIHPAQHIPLMTAREVALENLGKLYRRALKGDAEAVSRIEVITRSEGEKELARYARMLLDELDRPVPAREVEPGKPWGFVEHRTLAEVEAPSEINPDGGTAA